MGRDRCVHLCKPSLLACCHHHFPTCQHSSAYHLPTDGEGRGGLGLWHLKCVWVYMCVQQYSCLSHICMWLWRSRRAVVFVRTVKGVCTSSSPRSGGARWLFVCGPHFPCFWVEERLTGWSLSAPPFSSTIWEPLSTFNWLKAPLGNIEDRFWPAVWSLFFFTAWLLL